jgi:hypothetical protein
MAVKTTEEQLESVQTAIAKIEAGSQSYTIDDITYSKANIASLYKREERLLARYTTESGNRPVMTSINLSNMGY